MYQFKPTLRMLVLVTFLASACAPKIRSSPSACGPGSILFYYTNSLQSFILPQNCASSPQIYIKMWGAGGGGANSINATPNFPGGGGAYLYGAINLIPNKTYSVLVGQGGLSGSYAGVTPVSGGYGGGGAGYSTTNWGEGGGGGRSAFQLSGTELLTAAGGGGGASTLAGFSRAGGAGGDHITGGISGQAGGLRTTDACAGKGASPLAGGAAGVGNGSTGNPGFARTGGDGSMDNSGGGGGGYFGGGGGGTNGSDPCGGGGGSSFIGGLSYGTSLAGSGVTPGNTSDSDWNQTAGVGGNLGVGGNGLVVVYYGANQIAAISPTSGTSAGGTTLTLYGLGFTSFTTVTIAGRTCTQLSVSSANQLSCTVPSSGSLGTADVVVSTPLAQNAIRVGGFTYTP